MAEFTVNIDTGSGLASADYVPGSIAITLSRLRAARARWTLRQRAGSHPWRMDQACTITNNAASTTYFSGTLQKHSARMVRERLRDVAFEAAGDDVLLESGRVRVQRRYTDTLAGDVLKDINDKDFGSTFATTAIVDGPTIGEIIFDGVSGREALEMVEDATPGFAVFISSGGAITYDKEVDLAAAPFDIAPGSFYQDDRSVRIERGPGAFYNRVAVYGPEQTGEEIKELVPQAVNTNVRWGTKHPISCFLSSGDNKITDTTNTITYNAKQAGQGTSEVDASYDFSWEPGKVVVLRTAALTAGNVDLQVEYCPRAPLVFAIQDTLDIDRRGGWPAGVFEAPPLILDRLVPVKEAVQMGIGYLNNHALREFTRVTYAVSTATAGAALLTPGMRQTIEIIEEGVSGLFTIEEVVYRDRIRGEVWDMTVTALQGRPRTGARALGQALKRQAAPTPENFTDQMKDAVLYATPWRDDIEALVTCTLADV